MSEPKVCKHCGGWMPGAEPRHTPSHIADWDELNKAVLGPHYKSSAPSGGAEEAAREILVGCLRETPNGHVRDYPKATAIIQRVVDGAVQDADAILREDLIETRQERDAASKRADELLNVLKTACGMPHGAGVALMRKASPSLNPPMMT